jgi:hypothetical protein
MKTQEMKLKIATHLVLNIGTHYLAITKLGYSQILDMLST